MEEISMIVSGSLVLFSVLLFLSAYLYRRRQLAIFDKLGEEAQALLDTLTNKKTESEKQSSDSRAVQSDLASRLQTPAYLTTLCTILVKQAGGEVRLYEEDFNALAEEEFVSVFVDTADNSILLRMNSTRLWNTTEDESIFH
tara:strand:+ start:1340 stop:1765 length:426 start_codon:yes stop_codon:yes gene_type:complete